jgi:hypothetical protein
VQKRIEVCTQHVVARDSSQPHVVARDSSQPHVVAQGHTQLQVRGPVIVTATKLVAVTAHGKLPRVKGGRPPAESDAYPEKIKARGCCAPVWEVDHYGNKIETPAK